MDGKTVEMLTANYYRKSVCHWLLEGVYATEIYFLPSTDFIFDIEKWRLAGFYQQLQHIVKSVSSCIVYTRVAESVAHSDIGPSTQKQAHTGSVLLTAILFNNLLSSLKNKRSVIYGVHG